jgi:2-oxoglutarate ferredoxin oxidoreductase subunit gamma
MKNKTIEILFAGFGGQGIMLMGKLLAQAGLSTRRNVTWMPAYGAEVRGGTAYSVTKISDTEIANPIISKPDILVAMNGQSLAKYSGLVKPGGVIITNSSMSRARSARRDVKNVSIPMTELASKLGSARSANMIAVGAVVKYSKLFPLKAVFGALKELMPGKESVYQLNRKAVEKGYGSSR